MFWIFAYAKKCRAILGIKLDIRSSAGDFTTSLGIRHIEYF